MDLNSHHQVLQHILHPDRDGHAAILAELGLDGPPSQEQVHREIEEKLLLPKDKFPDHWLSVYQEYVAMHNTAILT